MKWHNKKFTLITLIICSLVLFGCKNIKLDTFDNGDSGKSKEQITDQPKDSKREENNNEVTPVAEGGDIEATGKEDNPVSVIQPAANIELAVYTVSSDAEVVTTTAAIPKSSEITPQLIVDTVKDAMAENAIMIGIESVTTENTSVIVSFYEDQPPLSNVGAGYETAILDAIAQSLLENLKDYNKVIYRVEGKAYNSGHIELGIDEVYLVD